MRTKEQHNKQQKKFHFSNNSQYQQYSQSENDQSSWKVRDEAIYFLFLKKYSALFDGNQGTQFQGIFKQMSQYMKNKTNQQCSSHHRYYKIKYKSVDGIIRCLLDNFHFPCEYDFKEEILRFKQFLIQENKKQMNAFIQHKIVDSTIIGATLQQNSGNSIFIKNPQIKTKSLGETTLEFPLQLIISIDKWDQLSQRQYVCKQSNIQQQKPQKQQIKSSWFIKQDQKILQISQLDQIFYSQKENFIENQQSNSQLKNKQKNQFNQSQIFNFQRKQIKLIKPRVWIKSQIQKVLIYIALNCDQFQNSNPRQKQLIYKKLQQYVSTDKSHQQCRQKIRSLMKGFDSYKQMLQKQLIIYDITQKDVQNQRILLNNIQYLMYQDIITVKKLPRLIRYRDQQVYPIDVGQQRQIAKQRRIIKTSRPIIMVLKVPQYFQKQLSQKRYLIENINTLYSQYKQNINTQKLFNNMSNNNHKKYNFKIKQYLFDYLKEKLRTSKTQNPAFSIICYQNNIQITMKLNQVLIIQN